ncbi:hypothetical protein LDENG_00079820, partial [Lucifuga dentata]
MQNGQYGMVWYGMSFKSNTYNPHTVHVRLLTTIFQNIKPYFSFLIRFHDFSEPNIWMIHPPIK